ncbi:MAG: hypothetical protein LRY50_15005, partial [Geovibrio sp.]|nr:hypothetical protein [Geovibrio sp.]
ARKDYFTAGSITFLLNLGHYLEESAEYRSDKMLKASSSPKWNTSGLSGGSRRKKRRSVTSRLAIWCVQVPGR